VSWQNILKAPRKKQLTDDMREVSRALISLSDDKLEQGVVDFVKETNMKRSKILETLSRISGHLRSAPTETYFDEEPFNVKHAYKDRRKLSTFIDKINEITMIINTIGKDGEIRENKKIIKKLYEDDEYDKMVQYLNGEISFSDKAFQNQNELVETKKEVGESGVSQRLDNFSSLLKDNKSARRKLLNTEAFSKPEVVGYKIQKGTNIVLPVAGDEVDSIVEASGLKLKVNPIVKSEDGKMEIGGKDVSSVLENAKIKSDIVFAFTGFPEYVTREQILPLGGGVALDSTFELPSFVDESKEVTLDLDMIENFKIGKKININRTPIAKALKLEPYVEFKKTYRKNIITDDRETISRQKEMTDNVDDKTAIEYFKEVMKIGAGKKKRGQPTERRSTVENRRFLQGTSSWFQKQIDNYEQNFRVFDIFFDNKNSKDLETVLDSILTESRTPVKTDRVLEQLKHLASYQDESKFKEYFDLEEDLIEFIIGEYKRIQEGDSVSNTEWAKIIIPERTGRFNESRVDLQTRLLSALPEIEKRFTRTITLNKKERDTILSVLADSLGSDTSDLDIDEDYIEDVEDVIIEEIGEIEEDENGEEVIPPFYPTTKSFLENMELNDNVYFKDRVPFKMFNLVNKLKSVFGEEEEANVPDTIEVTEYTFTKLFEKFAQFTKGLDSKLNGNRDLNTLYKKIDKNNNEKIDADENQEAPIRDFKKQVLLRYGEMRESLLNEIKESIKITLKENLLRNPKGKSGKDIEPISWLKDKGIRG
jgi:hypothetical protein